MFLLLLSLLSPGYAKPADPAALATLRQETLPELKRRATEAKERAKAAELFFASKAPLEGAWPALVDAPLNEPGYLYGRLQALQERDEARALERIAAAPEGLPAAQITQRSRALDTAIEAEVRVDALERQLLSSLIAGLKRAPDLQAAAMERTLAEWRAQQRLPAGIDPADPSSAGLIEQARQAGELEVILKRYQNAAILVMTVPGDLSLARLVRADLTRMAGRSTAERAAAQDRIARALPLLPSPLAAEAQVVLDALEQDIIASRLVELKAEEAAAVADREPSLRADISLEALRLAAKDADSILESAQDALAPRLASEPTTSLDRLRQEEARQRIRILEIRRQTAQDRLEQGTKRADSLSVAAGAAQTQVQVNDAQRMAEDARRRAEAAGKQDLQNIIADLQTLSASMAEEERIRHSQVNDTITQLQDEQRTRQEGITKGLTAPPALRATELQQEYIEQLQWTERLRRRLSERQTGARTLAEKNATVQRRDLPNLERIATAAGHDRDLTRDVQLAVEAAQDAMDERLKQSWRETDAVTRMLRTAREDLRRIREQLSRIDQISAEREANVDPALLAAAEVADVPAMVGERYRRLQELESWSLANISRRILAFLIQSFNIVLVLLGWHLLRNQGAEWVERMVRISQQLIPRSARQQQRFDLLVDVDITGLTKRITPTIRPAADALAAGLIHASVSRPFPILGALTLLWLIRTLLALTPKLVDLLVVDTPNERFALLQTSPLIHRLISQTAQVLVWWWLLLGALHYLVYEILRADMLDAVLSSLTMLLLLALMVRELKRWGPAIRAHVQSLGSTSWLAGWMTTASGSTLLSITQAFAGLLFSIAHLATQLTVLLIEGRGGMTWVGSLIAQHSLKQINQDCPPLAEAEIKAIRSAHQGIFLHEALVNTIESEHARWLEDRRGGMVALIGASGAGKTLVLQRCADRLTSEDRTILHLTPPRRMSEPAMVLSWLSSAIGLTHRAEPGWIGLTRALREVKPTIFLIDEAHLLLLRAVGGFSSLRRLINLMHATAEQHFWVVAFHQQSWSFLEGSAVPVSIDLFRAQIEIHPLSPPRLAEWLSNNTRAAGFEFDFDNLIASAMLGADPSRSLDRIKTAFWRRLTDISEGNPKIALHFWLNSLRHPAHPELEIAQDPDNANLIPLDVVLYNPDFSETVDSLTDTELFVLAALVIHDGLSVERLASALNTTRGIIRGTCRHLQILDVLVISKNEYCISLPWLPAITRTLRQRHFLHNLG